MKTFVFLALVGATLFGFFGCGARADDCYLNGLCTENGKTAGDCDGDPREENTNDDCAVFVDTTARAPGSGTKAAPFASLADAIAKSDGRRIFACGALHEAVVGAASFELWGGFDCGSWAWDKDGRTTLDAAADQVPLAVRAPAEVATIHNFAIAAKDAEEAGGSSVATIFDDGVKVTFDSCAIAAGNGAAGLDGEAPMGKPKSGLGPEKAPRGGCIDGGGSKTGGIPAVLDCGNTGTSQGGIGGDGSPPTEEDALSGGDGEPLNKPDTGGDGDTGGGCEDGGPGGQGFAGTPGQAGSASGTLSLSGVQGGDGLTGPSGEPGQGGGGGGGAKIPGTCGGNSWGPGGGAGGTGGCGGAGGPGGGAGGSSIAIVSLGADLTLTNVKLSTGNGADGGAGADGQAGADGANGGEGATQDSAMACAGGRGGRGGKGGPGGGGRGGHAIAIAFAKAPAATVKGFVVGELGVSGGGGTGLDGNSGSAGETAECWDFAEQKPCS